MEDISQRELEDFFEIPSQPQKGRLELPCAGCRALNFLSVHEPVASECSLKGCSACATLARIDDDISTTYERLTNLVRERQQSMTKFRHDTIIHRLPVEILSSIFVFVKDAILDFDVEKHSDVSVHKPRYQQPSQSPPLLVGAVCKRWREVTLTTPRLWTDIIVNLIKCADGQSNMVTSWARRAGALPLDITIFAKKQYVKDEEELLEEVGDVLWAIRQVAVRWNDIALRIPQSLCNELLNNLQETPTIGTLFLEEAEYFFINFKLQHPLRLRRFVSAISSHLDIPFEWNRLVFVDISAPNARDILHIIQHAHNLRYCIAVSEEPNTNIEYLPLTSPITNLSLIHLYVSCNIIGHLNLPSLSYLDYTLDSTRLVESFDSVVEFIETSCPRLDKFIIRLYLLPEEDQEEEEDAFPSFEKLPGITSIYFDYIDSDDRSESWMNKFFQALTRPSPPAILPRLEELGGSYFHFSGSVWKSFSRLFCKDSNPAESRFSSDTSIVIMRPLLKIEIFRWGPPDLSLDRSTFLCLLKAKKSGANLVIKVHGRRDFFECLAPIFGVEV